METPVLIRLIICLLVSLLLLIGGIVLLIGKPKINVMFLGYVGKMTLDNNENKKVAVRAVALDMILFGITLIIETLIFALLAVESIICMPIYGSTLILGMILMLWIPKLCLKRHIKANSNIETEHAIEIEKNKK